MTTVITGVDGSEPAHRSAATAAQLASALGGTLIVVSAYERMETKSVDTGDMTIEFTTEEEALHLATVAAQRFEQDHPSLTVRTQARQGRPAEALLACAESVDADLIVVGNKRVQGVSRLLGSIGTEILHKANCDVYIAHTHSRD